jgi:hypothetical protein
LLFPWTKHLNIWSSFVIKNELLKVNNRPTGENSPNLVTLPAIMLAMISFKFLGGNIFLKNGSFEAGLIIHRENKQHFVAQKSRELMHNILVTQT